MAVPDAVLESVLTLILLEPLPPSSVSRQSHVIVPSVHFDRGRTIVPPASK